MSTSRDMYKEVVTSKYSTVSHQPRAWAPSMHDLVRDLKSHSRTAKMTARAMLALLMPPATQCFLFTSTGARVERLRVLVAPQLVADDAPSPRMLTTAGTPEQMPDGARHASPAAQP